MNVPTVSIGLVVMSCKLMSMRIIRALCSIPYARDIGHSFLRPKGILHILAK